MDQTITNLANNEQINTNPFVELVNDFERSLKSFVSIYDVEITENRTNTEFGKKATLNQIELNKKAIEQQTEDVYEKARELERLFMKYRMDILKKDPELLIKEEISCMKAELVRKEELLNDTKLKIGTLEGSLKKIGVSLDHQIKSKNEMSTYSYMSNEMQSPSFIGAPNAPPTSAVPHFP